MNRVRLAVHMVVLTASFAALAAALPALAAKPAGGILHRASETLLWTAARGDDRGDRFVLKVNLPKRIWENRRGGVQVAVRWPIRTKTTSSCACIAPDARLKLDRHRH